MKKRSISIHGHRTSISLEDPFWEMLQAIAKERGQSLAGLVREVDLKRDGGLSSALRLFVLAELKKKPGVWGTVTGPLEQ